MNTTPSSPLHSIPTTASDLPRSDQHQPHIDATRRVGAAGERALVLGGGGSTGNAWLIGVIAGLFDAGLDVTTADLTVGTSAGSTAAAQIAGATPTELLAAILAAAPQQRTGPVGSDRGRVPTGPVADHLERMSTIIASAEDAADMRRRMGAAALDMDAASDGSWSHGGAPPSPRGCPVSAGRDERCSSRRSMPVPVNRSCSTATAESTWRTPSPPAVPVAFPTGSATTDTSTAATDATRTPIWQPDTGGCWCCRRFGGRTLHPLDWGMQLAAQVDELRAGGSRVETIFPDGDCRAPVRRQRDGSVAASARRSSRLRARQSPRRAARRILALTPTNPIDRAGVTTPAHAAAAHGRDMPPAFVRLTWARSAVLTDTACRSWVNGSSPAVRYRDAGSSRPTSSTGGRAAAREVRQTRSPPPCLAPALGPHRQRGRRRRWRGTARRRNRPGPSPPSPTSSDRFTCQSSPPGTITLGRRLAGLDQPDPAEDRIGR